MQKQSLKLAPFTCGEVVYFMQANRITKAKIKAVFDMRDGLNIKYLVENSSTSRWMIDHSLYHSIDELLTDLKSCIIT